MPWRYSLVTHTDLDGVSAAAIILRATGARLGVDARLEFTEPYRLHKSLKSIASSVQPGEVVTISDIGANPDTFERVVQLLGRIVERGGRVYWFDHHRWEPEWLERLASIGVRVYVETDTCGAGVVARHVPDAFGVEPDGYVAELVRATCAADIWLWDHPAAPKLYRVVDWKRGRAGDKWRRRLVEKFAAAKSLGEILGDGEVARALMEYVDRELANYEKSIRSVEVFEVDGCRVVVALKRSGPPSRSFLARTLAARYGADVVAIIHRRGISLRSENVDVRSIAKELGGGGHLRAAGAPLAMPLLWRIVAFIYPRLRLKWAARRIHEAVLRAGCRRITADSRVD